MISREEARKRLIYDWYDSPVSLGGKLCVDSDKKDGFLEALSVAIEALSQPERPKGRWIRNNLWTYECSCCGRLISMVLSNEKINKLYPYCHCGADMRGEEE